MASISYIEDLGKEDIALLTKFLADTLPDLEATQWLRDQETILKTFPPQLLRPTNLLPRLALALQLPFVPGKAILCPSHKQLNPQLIHRLFLQISAESTVRLIRLVSSPELKIHPVSPIVSQFIQRIQTVNSLWMDPETFVALFHSRPKFRRVESGCEACILAHIGGNRQLLTDLRTAMLGRRRKHAKKQPVLWAVVEGWILWTGERDEIHAESESIGREVRIFHRILQLTRRGTPLPEKYQTKIVQGPAEAGEVAEPAREEVEIVEEEEVGEGIDDDDEYDFEHSIIEYYHNILSTPSLSVYSQPTPQLCDSTPTLKNLASQSSLSTIHPAFRESLVFCPSTGTFEPRRFSHPVPRPAAPAPPPLPPRQLKVDNREKHLWFFSNDTLASGFCSEAASSSTNLLRTAEKRAESYKKLVVRATYI